MVARARGVRPEGLALLALALGMFGVGIMTLPGTRGSLDPLGAAALLVASLAWSVGTFHVPRRASPYRSAGMQLLVGGALLLLLSAVVGEWRGWQPHEVGRRSLLALLYLVTFGSVLAFGAYVWLLGRVSAAKVASHTYVNPIIAVALGTWLGGEALSPRILLSAALVLAAVLLLWFRLRQRT